MTNFIKTILIVFAFISTHAMNAQSTKFENTLLWKVSGNGLEKPSYLFGTFHALCGKNFVIKSKVDSAFSKTSKLVLELNLADSNEIKIMGQSAISPIPLTKKLTNEQVTKLDAILKDKVGVPLKQFDNYSLETIMSVLMLKELGCNDIKSCELEFIAKAKEKRINVVGLEKVSEQFAILQKSFTDDEYINYFQTINPEMMNTLTKAYLSENITELYEMTTTEELIPKTRKQILLDERNLNWTKIMPSMMQKESIFFAFGAAHLGGENGVINLLRKAGYKVDAVLK
jgi:uncharacterized protein YbaP (TraB family)